MLLRPYQENALSASLRAYQTGTLRQLLVLPTASGKTVIFSNLASHHKLTGRVLVIVNQEELAQQAADKLKRWNPDDTVGIEMADSRAASDDRFVVASVQTLAHSGGRRLKNFTPSEFSLIIADEAHLSVSPSWMSVFDYFGITATNPYGILLVGCTATPNRTDKQGLASVYDEIVFTYSTQKGIADGWLADISAFRATSSESLDGVPIRAGEFALGSLSRAINTPERNNLIVDAWKKNGEGRQTIVFCSDIAHAQSVAKEFADQGFKSEAIWGDDTQRSEKIFRLRSGETTVLANCQILVTGFDCWQVGCIIMAMPTGSQLRYIQSLGRGLRIPDHITNLLEAQKAGIKAEKTNCIVIDVADNCTRHSLVNLPSVFGLPPKMDLKGASVVKAVDKVQALAIQNPTVEFDECEDFTKIESYIEQVDLFKVHFGQEVLDNSEFQWHKTFDGYRLTLPNKEFVEIKQNVLRFSIKGKVEGAEFEGREDTIEEAFHYADGMIRRLGRKLINMLRRESKAKWANDACTEGQRKYLGSMLKANGLPIPDWSKISKHEASVLLGKMRASGWGKKGKAA
jgi:ATP-dependent helicase IRC3